MKRRHYWRVMDGSYCELMVCTLFEKFRWAMLKSCRCSPRLEIPEPPRSRPPALPPIRTGCSPSFEQERAMFPPPHFSLPSPPISTSTAKHIKESLPQLKSHQAKLLNTTTFDWTGNIVGPSPPLSPVPGNANDDVTSLSLDDARPLKVKQILHMPLSPFMTPPPTEEMPCGTKAPSVQSTRSTISPSPSITRSSRIFENRLGIPFGFHLFCPSNITPLLTLLITVGFARSAPFKLMW